ncbi:arsenic transporter [Cupriavidus neocaledonicus]|uniref:Arsenical pump membrane protein oxyanion translocase (Similar to arsB) n=1 Tax=Cupriavidus neocaledonicus TaxID=1040979 RepID=A0A375HRI9_9BURK|nr:arsenic transporter [Cupriavidus neocaledonicus]SOZ38940.1 Arsenical pump membrane protein; oxyanion translocase (similar to arsB) [Cupriavidus neocaledonicus]SPD59417.1 Arsenical pump membrane protein oxyanion translocase (Similar to arsB) [Cupriavidus neocaledonicus]
MSSHSPLLIWSVAALTTAGVLFRPFRLPEAFWAAGGALLLCATGLMALPDAFAAVLRGYDVYLFLAGMMLIAELARKTGLFDHVAALAVRQARGSAPRLFLLVYGFGTLVTAFMSNDATAVVLTPAVLAATRAARVRRPLPYLYACAFIANAASFVLPISNPANLVIFGERMPALAGWLASFALPSLAAILATLAALWWTQRAALAEPIADDVPVPPLSLQAWMSALGIVLTGLVLLVASLRGNPLGWPTCAAGVATLLLVCATRRELLWPTLREVSWSVLPMVAGLFVLVAALEQTAVIRPLADAVAAASRDGGALALLGVGAVVALAGNVVNNLPAGLIGASALAAGQASHAVSGAVLIGIDLGPNLSVTGSLATLLWLTALRREGHMVSAGQFLRVGAVVMPAAMLPALALLLL